MKCNIHPIVGLIYYTQLVLKKHIYIAVSTLVLRSGIGTIFVYAER